jgi:signal transduction histidine kinase
VTSILVHLMVDRARHFTSSDFQDEKLVSLGKLAAGLAHELNNPASAVTRNARELEGAVLELESAAREVGASGMSAAQATLLDNIGARCLERPPAPALTPLQRSDREESLADWLQRYDADAAMAGPLADSAATAEYLDELANALSGQTLRAALRWVAAGCQVRQLVSETQTAGARVHSLVAAVKAFTYMDKAIAPAPVDLEKSLSDTLAVLAGKARAKRVGLELDVQPDLPPIRAVGGELNQVWANLIENAIDAVPEGGRVTIKACREGDEEFVRIVDNGPGIPPEIQTRIFDPFFTTKPVGEGAGLGLDIVNSASRSTHRLRSRAPERGGREPDGQACRPHGRDAVVPGAIEQNLKRSHPVDDRISIAEVVLLLGFSERGLLESPGPLLHRVFRSRLG